MEFESESIEAIFHGKIHNFFTLLQSEDPEICCQTLKELKVTLIPDKPELVSWFVRAGGLRHIIAQLEKHNLDVATISLDILNHCVLEPQYGDIFQKLGGLDVLHSYTQHSYENYNGTLVLSGCFRVIGSLALHSKEMVKTLVSKYYVFVSLKRIFDCVHQFDEETLCSAIRIVQNLVVGNSTLHGLMICSIYEPFADLLIKTESVNIQKQLFDAFFHILSLYPDESCADENSSVYWRIDKPKGGKLIARLVELRLSRSSVIATSAPRLLFEFIGDKRMGIFRPLVLINNQIAFKALIPVVKEEIERANWNETPFLDCLLLMTNLHPYVRDYIRNNTGMPFPYLLRIVKETDPSNSSSQSPSQLFEKMKSLHSRLFRFFCSVRDDKSAIRQLGEGGQVVELLTKKVMSYTEAYRSGRITESSVQNDNIDEENSAPPTKKRRMSCQSDNNNCCYEKDMEQIVFKLNSSPIEGYTLLWPVTVEKANLLLLHREEQLAIDFLSKLSRSNKRDPTIPRELMHQKTAKAMMDYLVETPKPSFQACTILFSLAWRPTFFNHHIRSYFPSEVFLRIKSHRPVCCPFHKSLQHVGEYILDEMTAISPNFYKEIEKVLSEDTDDLTSSGPVALAVPMIIKSQPLLKRYVEDLRILNVIAHQLRSPESRTYAVAALASLGASFKMDNQLLPKTSLTDVCTDTSCKVADAEEDVFFQMSSDQKVIGGVKGILQEASSYFEAMFRGSFRESQVDVVQLDQIPAPVLQVVLHLIYGCGSRCSVLQGIERLVACDNLAYHLLLALDCLLMWDRFDSISNLIANQERFIIPVNFVALMASVKPNPLLSITKIARHLEYLPFSYQIGIGNRLDIIDAVLKSDAADDAIVYWKTMFLSKIESSANHL